MIDSVRPFSAITIGGVELSPISGTMGSAAEHAAASRGGPAPPRMDRFSRGPLRQPSSLGRVSRRLMIQAVRAPAGRHDGTRRDRRADVLATGYADGSGEDAAGAGGRAIVSIGRVPHLSSQKWTSAETPLLRSNQCYALAAEPARASTCAGALGRAGPSMRAPSLVINTSSSSRTPPRPRKSSTRS